MTRRQWISGAIVVAVVVLILGTSGPPPPEPNRPGTFSFAVLGDAPYYWWEAIQFRIVLESIDSHDVAHVIHVGDVFWKQCTDEHYEKVLARFNGLRHPVIYTPGDNEWLDCGRPESGGFDPQERLRRIRQIFFANPNRSVGGRPIELASQPRFPENARWDHEDVVFATVHLVGKGGPELQAAAVEWLRQTFAHARSRNAAAVVIAFQATPGFERPHGFEPFLSVLEEESKRFGKPVLAAHGDGHVYTIDHPRRAAPNLTRMQVPGSPEVGWVRVVVRGGSFQFEPYVVPSWKYF